VDKRFLGILAGIIIIFVGIVAISNHSNNGSSGSNSGGGTQPTHNVMGNGAKGVTLMEYGDFECPICGAYYEPLKQAVAQLNNDIYFQFRNLPLVSIHPNAFAGARAAQAAALQGKFWQMHDLLYQNQSDWVNETNVQPIFENYAKELGLNVTKFKQDYASSQVNDAINADLNAFSKTGQEMATPTIFIDGKYVPNTEFTDPQTGAPSADKIVAVVNAEIAKKNSGKS